MENINALCDTVREIACAIHKHHSHGHLEKVYENALAHRLRKAGIEVAQQYPIKILDEDGTVLGDYRRPIRGKNIGSRVESRENAGR